MMKLMLSFLAISSVCSYCQQPENSIDLVYREGVNFKLQNYRIVKGLLYVVYEGSKKDSLGINLMVREGEIVAYSHDKHLTIFLNLDRNNSIFIERPHDDKVSTAWFEFKDSLLDENYSAALTAQVDYFFLHFTKKSTIEFFDGEKWRPKDTIYFGKGDLTKSMEYDTVKCFVQHVGEIKRSYFAEGGNETAVMAVSKAWVIRKIVVRNNEDVKSGDILYTPQVQQKYTPVKFLYQNKKLAIENVWSPNNQPQYILKDW